MCCSFSLAATSLLIRGETVDVSHAVGCRGLIYRNETLLCQMTSRILSEIKRSRTQLMSLAVPHTRRCEVGTCYCVVTPTWLMPHDRHSHVNASILIGCDLRVELREPLSLFILSIIDCLFPPHVIINLTCCVKLTVNHI